jgi:hypothetical protein
MKIGRLALSVVALGALVAPGAPARSTSSKGKFEVAGTICDNQSRTFINFGAVAASHPKYPRDVSSAPLATPAILFACAPTTIQVSNFRWPKQWKPATNWEPRAIDFSVVKVAVTKTTYKISRWQYLEDGTVIRRFDGFPLNRPYLTTSAIDALNFPSTCNPLDSPILTTPLNAGREALFDEAFKVDPDLRVRELLDGKREVVTYKAETSTAQRLATDLKASKSNNGPLPVFSCRRAEPSSLSQGFESHNPCKPNFSNRSVLTWQLMRSYASS